MRYIIMCGGWHVINQPYPSPLRVVNGEKLVERTIRLLKEQGVTNIAISSEDDRFKGFGVRVLKHANTSNVNYYWINCFYPTKEAVCYLMGDVYYSPNAIEIIVSTKTNDIEFFASAEPFSSQYIKNWAEPFAFKVQDVKRFWKCVRKAKRYNDDGCFKRSCISWELWQVIKGTPLNEIRTNYTVINDYTTDVDNDFYAQQLERVLKNG